MERIQKIIANAGICSRRKAEELIENGKVKLNGELAKLGDKAEESDKIEVEGKSIQRKEENHYYILNKPKGILVTKEDPQNRRIIYNLNVLGKSSIKDKDINPTAGFKNYGNIKTSYLILSGSIQGPSKRQILLTPSFRPSKTQFKKKLELVEVLTK